MVGTALQPEVTPQTADAPLDAGAPAIAPAPGAVPLALTLSGVLGPERGMATWRTPKASVCSSTPLVWTPRSPSAARGSSEQSRCCSTAGMAWWRSDSRSASGEAGDDPAVDFREHDLTTELHRGSALVPRDEAGVWLKQTQHFLASGDLLTFQHTGLGLRDDALNEGKEVVDLGMEPPGAPGEGLQLAV